jgi:putative hemolysin
MAGDLLLLLILILLNGIFALSEIAIVSARRARLIQMAEGGSSGARHALALAAEPTRFLSSVQVGITSIGIMNGAIGEGAIAGAIRAGLEGVPPLAPYAQGLSLTIMVVLLTYFSLIFGELVPKRLALTHPEAVAASSRGRWRSWPRSAAPSFACSACRPMACSGSSASATRSSPA